MQRSQADLLAAALETPLFRGLPAAFVEHAIAQGYVERFAPGTPVLRSGDARRRLGVLLLGSAEVYKPTGAGRILMSVLAPGALLGAACLFLADAHAVTEVDATEACEVLFFDEETLKMILTKPKNAIVKQYQCLMQMDGVELKFDDEAIDLIAKEAIKRKTGARALRSIVEEIMLDVMYEVPTNPEIKTFTVTADMVGKKKNVAELIKLPMKNNIAKVEEDIA